MSTVSVLSFAASIRNILVHFPHVGSCRIIVQMLAHFIWIVCCDGWCVSVASIWVCFLPNQMLYATNTSLAVSRTLNWLTLVCRMHAIRYHMFLKFFRRRRRCRSLHLILRTRLETMATTITTTVTIARMLSWNGNMQTRMSQRKTNSNCEMWTVNSE